MTAPARHDSRGLPISTHSEHAAQRYREGVDLLLSLWPDAAEVLDEAIAADPGFALALAARARLHAVRAELPQARTLIAQAAEAAARQGTARERAHVDILRLAIEGQAAAARDAALAHLELWPRDVIVFSLLLGAFGLLAFSGRRDHDAARVDLCERHAAQFAADDWWFLTYRGWSHAENGDLARGRALTERALALRRHNVNAVHALAHVLHEAGEQAALERLIDGWLPAYSRRGALYSHIAWHAALAALDRGDVDRALRRYSADVVPEVSAAAPLNVLTDTTSFLWRLHLHGHAVPPGAWQQAASHAAERFPQPGLAFADLHLAMATAATGNRAEQDRRLAALDRLVAAGSLPAGPVVPALCRALQAFADGDFAACVRQLEPLLGEVVRLGGSGAQREVIEETCLVALMRSGEAARARALLAQRLQRRPALRDSRWLAGLDACV